MQQSTDLLDQQQAKTGGIPAAKGWSLEVDSSPSQPEDDYSPDQDLDCNYEKDPEPEVPSTAMFK